MFSEKEEGEPSMRLAKNFTAMGNQNFTEAIGRCFIEDVGGGSIALNATLGGAKDMYRRIYGPESPR